MKYFFHFLLLSAILTACSSTQPTKSEIPGATASKHVLENPGVVLNTGASTTSNTPFHRPLR